MQTIAGGFAIPIRSFRTGKSRLPLSDLHRIELVRELATRVVAACEGPCLIVTNDEEVISWAPPQAQLLHDDGNLNTAAQLALEHARTIGWARLVIAHADLARPASISEALLRPAAHEVWAVQSHRENGTPVISLPTDLEFHFSYGKDSFSRHREEAIRLQYSFVKMEDSDLQYDVDIESDMEWIEPPYPPRR